MTPDRLDWLLKALPAIESPAELDGFVRVLAEAGEAHPDLTGAIATRRAELQRAALRAERGGR